MSYIALKPKQDCADKIVECSPSVSLFRSYTDLHCTLARFRGGTKISEDSKKNLQKVFNDYLDAKTNFGYPRTISQLGSQDARVWALILDNHDFIKEMRNKALEVLSCGGTVVCLEWAYTPHITLTKHPLIVFAQNIPEKIFFDQLVFVE